LDTKFQITILTPLNSTRSLEDFDSLMDSLLLKKSKKYDIYFYYGLSVAKYGKYFLPLNDKIEPDYLEDFDNNVIQYTCMYNDNLIGLVINILLILHN